MSGTLWFTSDLHLGHQLVARLRAEKGLCPESEHDDVLAENWDHQVQTGDQVWVLGDLFVSDKQKHYALNWLSERPGIKHLIAGNHDPIFSGHRHAHREQSYRGNRWLDVFGSVQTFTRRRLAGQEVLLSHFPYPGTSEGTDANGRPFDDRYAQYRLVNLGRPILHGHTHRAEKLSWNRAPDGRTWAPQLHVGLDAWELSLVRQDELEQVLTDALRDGPPKH